jgi:acetyl esterase/lipase
MVQGRQSGGRDRGQPGGCPRLAPGGSCLPCFWIQHPAPTTGTSAADPAQGDLTPVPFWLVHGTRDPVVSITGSRKFAALLAKHGWPVQLEELPTDHAGVVMAEYDPGAGRCRPARNSQALQGGRRTAQILRSAARAISVPEQE